MSKRTVFIIVGALALVLLVLGGIYFFSRTPQGAALLQSMTGGVGKNTSGVTQVGLKDTSGTGASTVGGTAGTAGSGTAGSTGTWATALRQVAVDPVSGYVVYTFNGQQLVRYIERKTGHIVEIPADGTNATRVSNTTLPAIEDVSWIASSTLIFQKVVSGSSQTFFGAISTEDQSLDTAPIAENNTSFAQSPDAERVFYTARSGNVSVGYLASANGLGSKQLFVSPITQWRAAWSGASSLYLTTKASGNTAGYAYRVDQATGALSKILGDVQGLVVAPNKDGSSILYSQNDGGGMSELYLSSASASTDTKLATIAEKCAWNAAGTVAYCGIPQSAPDGLYPDAWYQGLVSLNDTIWAIDTLGGSLRQIATPQSLSGRQVDAIDLSVSPDGRYLFFINKKDSTLWEINLSLVKNS